MKSIFSRSIIYLAIFFIPVVACEEKEEAIPMTSLRHELNFEPALTNSEYDKLAKDSRANLVRSMEEFDHLVEEGYVPLQKLPNEVLQDFRSELKFRNNRLVGLGFGSIKKVLSFDEMTEVIAIFGVDIKNGFWLLEEDRNSVSPSSIQDYKGYECLSKGTCYENPDHICLSGC